MNRLRQRFECAHVPAAPGAALGSRGGDGRRALVRDRLRRGPPAAAQPGGRRAARLASECSPPRRSQGRLPGSGRRRPAESVVLPPSEPLLATRGLRADRPARTGTVVAATRRAGRAAGRRGQHRRRRGQARRSSKTRRSTAITRRVYTTPFSAGVAIQAAKSLEEVDRTLRELGVVLALIVAGRHRARGLARTDGRAHCLAPGERFDRHRRARRRARATSAGASKPAARTS